MANTELNATFALNLRNYLIANNQTQADLSRYMKVSTAAVAKWATGQTIPRFDKLRKICDWLLIEPSDLINKHPSDYEYLDRETIQLLHKVTEEPQYRALVLSISKLSPNDVELAKNFIERLSAYNNALKEAEHVRRAEERKV
ncbi:MAG: helix-turn-helix transcriptional regulator [Prevotella sp.]|nr:helix-turn-helix transcriptional regulator [Prevotella sp.]